MTRKEKMKLYHASYRTKNKDRAKEYHASYRTKNKDQLKEKQAEYSKKNRKQIKKRQAEYRTKNKDRLKEYEEQRKEERKLYQASYRTKNKDKRVEYRKKNKKRIKKRQIDYYKKNKDKFKKYAVEYSEKNKDQLKEKQAEYRKKNKDRIKERQANYYKKNKDKKADYYKKNKDRYKCMHGIQKHSCKDCIPLERLLKRANICNCCGTKTIDRNRQTKYDGSGMCSECDATGKVRTETICWNQIKDRLPFPSARDNTMTGGKKCNERRRRPDACWVGTDRIVHLEIQEHSHVTREVSCELAKMDNTVYGTAGSMLPHVFINFNPDGCDRTSVGLRDRCDRLVGMIQHFLACDITEYDAKLAHVVYMYYHTNALKHIMASKACQSIKVIDDYF